MCPPYPVVALTAGRGDEAAQAIHARGRLFEPSRTRARPAHERKLIMRFVGRYNPVGFMAHKTGDVWRALGCGAALAVLTAALCLAFAAGRDAEPLSLADLARAESIVMSCDESFSTAEPLWCADPTSPQCSPAAPDVPRIDLGDRVDLWLPPAIADSVQHVYTLDAWPRPIAVTVHGRNEHARLERPPRT